MKIGTTHMGRDIIALKVTQNAKTRTDNTRPAVLYNAMQHAREWLAGETCRRTLLYFTQNYDTTPDNRDRGRGHRARQHARAVVLVRLEPGRLRVHVHARQPPVAQEHGRQRRQRRARRGRRRRRPEPQPRHALGPGQRGLLGLADLGDLPRHRPGLRARDQGHEVPLEPRRLQVPEERPHGGRAAAVAERLPAVHAHARRRALRGLRGRRRQLGDRRQGLQRGRPRSGRSRATASTRTSAPSSTSPTAT